MPVYFWIGLICILYGIRFATRKQGLHSRPRLLIGVAMCLVGAAQFFREKMWLGQTILWLGVVVFVAGLIMMRRQMRGG